MIPKYLTIKGLYSYKTEQKIDFTELTKHNLFGIFGNVGAGKSSILEAIMLALYGEVERMGKIGRNYNIMNLSSKEMFIVFDFCFEGKLYRSKITGKRSNKKFQEVKVEGPYFAEWADGHFQQLNIKTAELLIGLKPDDFKKTIIIPQGTFQDFLQLGDTERARMMRELFSLERYELEPNAKFLQNKNEANIQILRGQLNQIGEVTIEIIEEKKVQLIDLQVIINNLHIDIEQKRKNENMLKQLKTDFLQWEVAQKQNIDLIKHETYFLELDKQINAYEMAVFVFKSLLRSLNENNIFLKKILEELNKKEKEYIENKALLEQLLLNRLKLTPQYEQRENLKKQTEETRKILNIQTAKTEIENAETRLAKGTTLLNEKKLLLDILIKQAENIEKERFTLRMSQPNLIIINAVKDWFSIYFNIEKELNRLIDERKKLEEKLIGIQKAKSVFIWKDLPHFKINLPNDAKISDIITQVKAKIGQLKTEIEHNQQERLNLKTIEKLETYAAELSEGQPCPLCGATHHPNTMQISEVRSILKTLDLELVQHKKEIRTLENIDNELITLNINYNNETERQFVLGQKISLEKQKMETHYQNFLWYPTFSPSNYAAVQDALRAATEFDNKMKTWEDTLRNIQKNKADTEKTIEQYQKELNNIQTDITKKSVKIAVLKAQITILDFETECAKSQNELNIRIENLDNEYITTEKEFHVLENQIFNCQNHVALLMGRVETLQENVTRLKDEKILLETELNEKLSISDFKNIEVIENILASNLNIAKERQRLTEYKEQKLLVAARLLDLTERLQGKEYNSDNHNALIADIQLIEQHIQKQNQAIGGLKREIFEKTKKLAERQKIEKILLEYEIRGENLSILRGLFQRSGFVNYASSVYLQSIIKAANERFIKLTKQQLRLEITENNGFIVRDMLNEGKLRDVRTLSGGQTFQAALSLALALSDHIQSKNAARQNFFFLDEGFGSLDRESLNIVFETLKDLRKENRIVGIISHVEDMRLEIERYLEVHLSESEGSQVNLIIG